MRKYLHVNVCIKSFCHYTMNGLAVVLGLLLSMHISKAQDLILNTYSGQSEIKAYKGGSITLKNGFNTAGHNVHIFISSEIQPVPIVPPVLSSNQNYLATWTAKLPIKDPNLLIGKPLKDVQLSVQYFDGLGRLVQTVFKQGSLATATGASGDLVTVKSYDQYGRDSTTLLPYVAIGTANGSYKEGASNSQQTWYNGSNSPVYGQEENGNNARSLTVFEPSPLNRIAETYGPGDSWVGSVHLSEAQRHAIKKKYWINTATDAVRIWDASFVSSVGAGFGDYTSTSTYSAGELYKDVTTNEEGRQVIEFKDKEGHTILRKIQLTATDAGTGSGHTGWLCTYYIYDELDNLRCVIQPKGVELLYSGSNNWSTATAIGKSVRDEQCFRYEYDNRGRMIIKKVPGMGPVYMVYDKHGRMVMRQDSLMRSAHNWIATQYDGLNRPDTTWQYNSGSATFSNILTEAASSDKYPLSAPTATSILTGTHYDDYIGLTLPAGMTTSYKDDWDSYFIPASTTSYPYPEKPTQTTEITTRGMVTWSQNKVLDSTPVLQLPTINIYDRKGRLIQTQSRNFTGGIDVTTTQYSWSSLPLVIVQKQEEKKGTISQISIVVSKKSYDDLGRVVKTEQRQSNNKIAAGAMTNFAVLSETQYDAIGQIKQKFLGRRKSTTNSYINTPLEKQLYDYNIRGWLLGVNRDYVRDAASTNTSATATSQTISGEMFTESSMDIQSVIYPSTNFFGFDLAYDKIDNVLIGSTQYYNARFDGNITGMSWKGANDKKVRKYDYSYDASNRLTNATFGQYSSAGFSNSTVNYTVDNLKYDANGNILSMNQYALKSNGLSAIIDQLTYNYSPSTNKLLNVIDKANDPNSDLGDFKYPTATKSLTTIDYTYDGNGNLITDKNKKITGITYNILNLPSVITVETNKGSIKYYYDAAGNRLRKRAVDNTITPSKTIVTTYIGGAVYQNDTLQFFGTSEGRVRPNSTRNAWIYDYFLKDHLANTRMLITDDYNVSSPILEASSYYPFGLEQKGIGLVTATLNYPGNKKKFVSQLLDDDLGLNWYQFKYRNHDPQIGRFIEIDPIASDYPFNSPFAYAENRPINGIDLEGKEFSDAVKNINNPYLASYYFSVWANSYSESINAGMRLQSGTSGAAATSHMPDGIAKNAVSLTAQLQDIQTASKPLVDELNTFATIGSLIPFGEAGIGAKVTSLGIESVSSLSISEISSGFGKEAGFSLKSISSANNAAKTATTVFRAVDATESTIIKNTGKFSLQPGGVEAKYFAKSLEDAHWYGQELYPNGYSIIKGTVNAPVNAAEHWFPHVDIGAYVFPKETLPYIIPH